MGGCFVFYETKQTERAKAIEEFQRIADVAAMSQGILTLAKSG